MEEVKATQSRKKVKDQLPSKIGGYKPIQALNSGAMGSLWLCRDPSLDRLVVAKRLHANLSQQDIYVKRFLQEGSILAHLNHPNILQPYALWKDSDGNYILVMTVTDLSSGQAVKFYLTSCGCSIYHAVNPNDADMEGYIFVDHDAKRILISDNDEPAELLLNED